MSLSFSYNLKPSIKFDCGLASRIGEELLPLCSEKRVLIISDPGVVAAGLADTVTAPLKKLGFAAELFSDIQGEISAVFIDRAAEMIRSARPSAIIGLGGGSALDAAKLSAAVAASDHDTEAYALMQQPLPTRAARLIMLPTTAGTGAEVTRTAVFTNSENHKVWAWGDELAPDLVILDPELTLTLPQTLTAATGLDAMVHAIEACTVKTSHPMAQATGLHAVRLIFQNLVQALDQPQDLSTRGHLLTASTLAGLAIDGAGTGLAHAIGHALGTVAGIHHGRAVTLALDVIFSKNATTSIDIHAEIATALGVQAGSAPVEETAKMGAPAFSDFMRQTGIEISLKPDGLSHKDLERLVEVIHSDENAPMLQNNCYCAGLADIHDFAGQMLSR